MQNNIKLYKTILTLIQILYQLLRSDVLHLTFYIITWLYLIYLVILELFMLFNVRLRGMEAFSES